MGMTLFSFIIVLGVLIFFHELGHFLVARLFGVGVEKFSLGFGPRIFGKKIGITDYRISAIPLGGYVKMIGEEPDAEVDSADIEMSFMHKHPLKKMLIVFAGPVFNVLLAVLIYFFMCHFSPQIMGLSKPSIGKVETDSPAQAAGLKKGDLITAIDGVTVSKWEDVVDIIKKGKGKTVTVSILREESNLNVSITPRFQKERGQYLIGIYYSGEIVDLNPFQALVKSITYTYNRVSDVVLFVGKLILGKFPAEKALGGPISIAAISGQMVRAGLWPFLWMIAFISINLAILNLFPLPPLDGGHILFFGIELIFRKSVNLRVREITQAIGFFLLITLMVYVFYIDIMRYFSEIMGFFEKAKGLFD
jgi:regulator of sigma E protease